MVYVHYTTKTGKKGKTRHPNMAEAKKDAAALKKDPFFKNVRIERERKKATKPLSLFPGW